MSQQILLSRPEGNNGLMHLCISGTRNFKADIKKEYFRTSTGLTRLRKYMV
jgi:hypothetical protein